MTEDTLSSYHQNILTMMQMSKGYKWRPRSPRIGYPRFLRLQNAIHDYRTNTGDQRLFENAAVRCMSSDDHFTTIFPWLVASTWAASGELDRNGTLHSAVLTTLERAWDLSMTVRGEITKELDRISSAGDQNLQAGMQDYAPINGDVSVMIECANYLNLLHDRLSSLMPFGSDDRKTLLGNLRTTIGHMPYCQWLRLSMSMCMTHCYDMLADKYSTRQASLHDGLTVPYYRVRYWLDEMKGLKIRTEVLETREAIQHAADDEFLDVVRQLKDFTSSLGPRPEATPGGVIRIALEADFPVTRRNGEVER